MSFVFTFVDFLIVTLCVLFGYIGYRSGFYNSLLALMGFHFALGLSLLLMRYTAGFFGFVLELPPDMSILFGMAFLFGVLTLGWVFCAQWIHGLVKMEVVEWFNRTAGVILSTYRGFLMISLFALGFTILPLTPSLTYAESYSMLFRRARCFLPLHYNYVRKLIPITPSFEQNLLAALRGAGGHNDRVILIWHKLGECTLTSDQLDEMMP